jgi:F-type H+-transporting ATPase subunit delta
MSHLKVAARYATSFLQQAIATSCLEDAYKDVLLFQRITQADKALLQTLSNPTISHEKKWTILKTIFSLHVCPCTLRFFELVSARKREAVLSTIMPEFLKQYGAYKGIAQASVTTTFKLSGEMASYFKNLAKSFTACKEVILTEYINPAIQGGFVLRMDDRQFDCSVATKLYKLKKQFSMPA